MFTGGPRDLAPHIPTLLKIGRKIEAILNFGKGTAFRLSGLLQVNCEAELRVTCYLIGGIQNLLPQKPYKGVKTNSRANFGKETVARVYRRLKWALHYSAQIDSGHA